MGQHSPEDVPNVYKQRGTWAIDTVRLMIWGDLRGLNLRQRAQFYELLFYYLHSFTMLVYVPSIVAALLGYVPFRASWPSFIVHMLPLVLATEAWLMAINRPYNDRRRRQRHPIRELWRVRDHLERPGARVHQGIDPGDPRRARAQADLQGHAQAHRSALALGPHPAADARCSRWSLCTLVYALRNGTLPRPIVLLPFVYWGGLYVALFAGFVARSWHGVSMLRRALPAMLRGLRGRPGDGLPALPGHSGA